MNKNSPEVSFLLHCFNNLEWWWVFFIPWWKVLFNSPNQVTLLKSSVGILFSLIKVMVIKSLCLKHLFVTILHIQSINLWMSIFVVYKPGVSHITSILLARFCGMVSFVCSVLDSRHTWLRQPRLRWRSWEFVIVYGYSS